MSLQKTVEAAPTDDACDPVQLPIWTTRDHGSARSSQKETTSLPSTPSNRSKHSQAGEEQPLESHEVIELQKFSERKAWIEEKIKFLEKMPPIEVFVGLDTLRSSSEEVPGLPSRAELQQWLAEHDAIEKETEMFDSGELQKLKKFTKAATQRNLSPEDTDLIELTLTTIYDLDKLLHLLRDRSENLELIGVRLTWEEQRAAAWADRHSIVADLQTFLATRARWTPNAYDGLSPEITLTRRPSITSLSSDSSTPPAPSALSRSARFKLGELLSRDAAQFVGRVTSLKHGKVSAAGKTLDKLIDQSRVKIPEELLDEQDRLEEKGINDVEGIDKFVMNVVMQWRKADEIYIETIKDKAAAQTLLEEIETAKLHQPNTRQATAFVARADGLVKRLKLRGDPASPSSSFTRPTHPLFPDQQDANLVLAQTLSLEISSAKDLISTVENLAREYRGAYEAVRRVETMCQDAGAFSNTLITVIDRLKNGVTVHNGDGTPPDLTSEACLDQSHHSVYLALLPSIFSELDGVSKQADQLLQSSPATLLALDQSGIDSTFKSRATSEIQCLADLRREALNAKKDITARVNRLQEARKVWTLMGNTLRELEGVRRQLGETMDNRRWRQESVRSATPPTPESPISIQFPAPAPADHKERLSVIEARLSEDITAPLLCMSHSLEAPLSQYLVESHKGLTALLENVRKMSRLLECIRRQADVMNDIRSQCDDFQIRIEDLRMQYDTAIQQVLTSSSVPQGVPEMHVDLNVNVQHIRDTVQAFVNGLSQRVPFVAKDGMGSSTRAGFVKRRFSSQDLRLGVSLQKIPVELPFELSALDDAVRRDSNSYAMRLSGELQGLQQKQDHLRLAWMAKESDMSLNSTIDSINAAVRELASHKALLSTLAEHHDSTAPLQSLLNDFEATVQEQRMRIARSFSPIRELLHRMDTAPGSHDPAVHEVICLARTRAVDDAELKFNTWSTDAETLRNRILEAQRLEARRLEEEEEARIAAERMIREEEERRAAEQAEKSRLEELRKAEEARLKEERRLEEEEEKRQAEEATRLLEQEKALAEERQLAKERQAEEERRAAEEAKKLELELEQRDHEERLRVEEGRLEEERRIQAEQQLRALEQSVQKQCESEERSRTEILAEDRRLAEAAGRDNIVKDADQIRQAAEAPTANVHERETHETQQDHLVSEMEIPQGMHAIEEAEGSKGKDNNEQKVHPPKTRAELYHPLGLRVAKDAGKTKLGPLRAGTENPTKRVRSPEARIHTKAKARHSRGSSSATITPKTIIAAETESDVFGLRIASSSVSPKTQEITDLLGCITALRKRLRSLSISETSHPTSSSALLPSEERAKKIEAEFAVLSEDTNHLPTLIDDPSVDSELKSLRTDVEISAQLIPRILDLARLSHAIHNCDLALSDLLEHIDTYPAIPVELASSHFSQLELPPDEQLSARLSFTKSVIEDMTNVFATVADDPRAIAEQRRIIQTWSELEDMGKDRIEGKKSRPVSVISSGKNSSGRNSNIGSIVDSKVKKDSYSNLSRRVSNHGRYLTPSQPKASLRRATSGSRDSHSRTSSRMSISSHRSASGPIDSSLFRTTFASRQRTISLSLTSPGQNVSRRPSVSSSAPRAGTAHGRRAGSPTFSDSHSYSHSLVTPSRSSTSTSVSTWARAPRPSNPMLPIILSPPLNSSSPKKRTYIANPRNKLDVAVGQVVNQLPVNINVEVVEDTWKDQSGKYWIGDQDPKLCFCRILRSQTVMVRVGGGWTELSKFIKDHFADTFRLLPDSPSRPRAREEKWINSATLLEAPETNETPPLSPQTPEPTMPFVPTLSLLTPNGQSPHSLKSTPSSGSPLMPMQFMRRADVENSHLRPTTPSKSPGHRLQKSAPTTPSRHAIWRP